MYVNMCVNMYAIYLYSYVYAIYVYIYILFSKNLCTVSNGQSICCCFSLSLALQKSLSKNCNIIQVAWDHPSIINYF